MTTHHTARGSPAQETEGSCFSVSIVTAFLIQAPPPPSPSAWLSLPLLLHTLEILHNYYQAKSWSSYSSLAAHILIRTFRSTNIDKAREIGSTQLSITTSPVLSMPLIFALLKGVTPIPALEKAPALPSLCLCQSFSYTFLIPSAYTAILIPCCGNWGAACSLYCTVGGVRGIEEKSG